ncbi:MAG TPA: transcription elongation factor GreA [Acidobacteriota bacterium]|nr:transcription elongation factor GreA [Acidobacteriota bacterium]HRR25290.1 transcription elongation factor GreA [Acidobacteriota bacterium]HRR56327.1 transcription elongation factor GreA [Acidobacteriota bacterium]HRV08373.1 transcription elongation factor GreA [Acidobacteriota bacterium]
MKDVKKKLEERIRKLEHELQDELPKALKQARELGDLRENAEYQAAKERQSIVQAELGHLRERLARLSLVNLERIPSDRASYGSTVVLYDLDRDEEVTYRLVMSEESDAANGKISTSSPIGRSLIGKQEGDEVEIHTPGGVRRYEILRLITLHDQPDDQEG